MVGWVGEVRGSIGILTVELGRLVSGNKDE